MSVVARVSLLSVDFECMQVMGYITLFCCCTAELYTNSGAAELPHALISASRLRVDCDVEDSCMLLASPFFNFGASVHLNFHRVRSGRDGVRFPLPPPRDLRLS